MGCVNQMGEVRNGRLAVEDLLLARFQLNLVCVNLCGGVLHSAMM